MEAATYEYEDYEYSYYSTEENQPSPRVVVSAKPAEPPAGRPPQLATAVSVKFKPAAEPPPGLPPTAKPSSPAHSPRSSPRGPSLDQRLATQKQKPTGTHPSDEVRSFCSCVPPLPPPSPPPGPPEGQEQTEVPRPPIHPSFLARRTPHRRSFSIPLRSGSACRRAPRRCGSRWPSSAPEASVATSARASRSTQRLTFGSWCGRGAAGGPAAPAQRLLRL